MRRVIGAVLVGLLAVGVAVGQGGKEKKEAAKPITGRCHCGYVKYRVQGRVIKCSFCDCRGCQRASGALKAPFVTVLGAAFTITAGKPAHFRSDSKAKCDCHGVWHFCPRCGTQVFWKPDKGKQLDIFAGTLDDTTIFQCKE